MFCAVFGENRWCNELSKKWIKSRFVFFRHHKNCNELIHLISISRGIVKVSNVQIQVYLTDT